MISSNLSERFSKSPRRWLALFNLNDGKWGRGEKGSEGGDESPRASNDDKPTGDSPGTEEPKKPQEPQQPPRKPQGQQDGPPDLEEAWREMRDKLTGLFGGERKSGGNSGNAWGGGNSGGGGNGGSGGGGGGSTGGFPALPPNAGRTAGVGAAVVGGVVALLWLGSGIYVVQEGEQAVITRFGKFIGPEAGVKPAGFHWRMPYPFERHEVVRVAQLRSAEVGRGTLVQAIGLKDSSMLTQDENIVDIRFGVQYRVKDPAEFLFNTANPEEAVVQAAESAIREVVGKSTMNVVLNEKRESISTDIIVSTQRQLDLVKAGVLIANVNIQNVQPPEQVQAAFDDALKAGQDGNRAKNEGQAYANKVVPAAEGRASRLKEEAEGYKARVVAQAEGDSSRFKAILPEYQRAPQATRDRMYIDTMQQIYTSTTKILIDTKNGANLLNLPLDRLLQLGAAAPEQAAPVVATPAAPAATPPPADARGRTREAR